MYQVIFWPEKNQGARETSFVWTARAEEGEILLDLAKRCGADLDAPCSGNGTCGKCRVRLVSGELRSKKSSHLSEEEYSGGIRLACMSSVMSDVRIEIPDNSSAVGKKIKSTDSGFENKTEIFDKTVSNLENAGIRIGNDLDLVTVNFAEPSCEDAMPDNERLIRAVRDRCGISDVKLSFTVLQKLSEVLRASSDTCNTDDSDMLRKVKCVISRTEKNKDHQITEMEVLDIFPYFTDVRVCALAADIGTTTVAAVIVDIQSGEILAQSSCVNAQVRYGADVISRIIEQQKMNGRENLQRAIIEETLNPMIRSMSKTAGILPGQIYRACIAGNTTMNHLMLGINADPIRMEPFIPSFFETDSVSARDIGLDLYKDSRIIVTPNIGSYVGGDITAGVFASMLWNREEMSLFIDLGTNGEIVFGNNEFMVSCACSAGPAFEGGDISCGMRASKGAIESCSIDKDTMEPSFEVIGGGKVKPAGICGSGLIDLISELFRCGIISPKGRFIREGSRIRRDEYGMGSYVIYFGENEVPGEDIRITEADIDNFIRAKSAVFSAVRLMLKKLDLDFSVIDRVLVAGGIGSGINIRNAVYIGMFPDIGEEKFTYLGNTSLQGAFAALISSEAETKISDIAHNMTYIELSSEPSYMDEFVAGCFLPHTDASLFRKS